MLNLVKMAAMQRTRFPEESITIKASPTKEFFISMLIKDITLIDAIGDLIDNSVDGAQRTAEANNLSNLNRFEIDIKVKSDIFEIKDNCGGIDVNIARKYAFRFGRPSQHLIEKHSIGQFGIGMKRAFFKIGNMIKVQSTSANSIFDTQLDVKVWRDQEDWDFQLSPKENLPLIPLENRGTTITIISLTEDAKSNFEIDSNFETYLIDEIRKEHWYFLNKGIKITINGKVLKPYKLKMICDDEFKPSFWRKVFEDGLSVEVLAGISEDKGDEGGWYIFCNNRLITGPDRSSDTGWTGKGHGADGVAAYHDQFYRFRGYVFFNADDASKLPWNTTKTGLNRESAKYQFVRKQMISMMRPVMTLMNKLKTEKEKNRPKIERVLNLKVNQANVITISDVLNIKDGLPESFTYPTTKLTSQTGLGNIAYKKPYPEIDKVKSYFKVTTLAEVGEKTFDFFYNQKFGR